MPAKEWQEIPSINGAQPREHGGQDGLRLVSIRNDVWK